MATYRIPLATLIDGVWEELRKRGTLPEVKAVHRFPEEAIGLSEHIGEDLATIPVAMGSLLCQLAIAERLEALVGAVNDLDARLVIAHKDDPR